MDEVVVRLSNVSKFYKLFKDPKDRLKEALHPTGKTYHEKFYALESVDLEVKRGEVLGILGRNGSGKSTLLKLITNVLTPSTGTVEVKGKISALLELGAGFNPEFSGIQNIYFYASILGLSKQEIETKLDTIIQFADLGTFIKQPVKSYSSGMKSRLGFAVAIHVEPDILILDEVLAVGDVLFRKKCFEKIHEFLNKNKTVIFVSHSANMITQFCTRAVIIYEHQIHASGSPKEITEQYERLLFSSLDKKKLEGNDKQQGLKRSLDTCSIDYLDNLTLPENIIKSGEEAQLQDFTMLNQDGLIVNQLYQVATYTLRAQIRITDNLNIDDLLVGVTIVTEAGIRLAGVELELTNQDDGRVCSFEKTFNCIFNPGFYSTIISCKKRDYSPDYYLMIADKVIFNVKTSKENFTWGMIQL